MTQSRPWRVSPEAFARDTGIVGQWLSNHRANVESSTVWSPCQPGDLLGTMSKTLPHDVVDLPRVLGELEQFIVPGLVRWDHPGWFAWFPSNGHEHALLGDFLGAALGQQGMLWMSSPACTEVEIRTLEWLRQAMGLPECFAEGGPGGGVIQDTASSAVLACMIAARDRVTNGVARTEGLHSIGKPVTVYASADAHSSVLKAARLCGIGDAQCRLVPVNDSRQMDVEALRNLVERDIAAGAIGAFCCATVGTTGCGAIDPVDAIAEVCESHGLWLHVDAAWAGTAALCEEFRHSVVQGAHRADSWCFNPHKWMGVNFDCSCLWLADRVPLIEAMSITPEYLRNDPTESGAVVDYRDWHVQLGRRFRSLKLWLLIRCTGIAAIAEMVRHHVRLACWLESQVNASESFELAVPRSLGLLCIRHVGGDEGTQRAIDAVNADGRFAVTHCRIGESLVMRVAIGSLAVEAEHVESLWGRVSQEKVSDTF